MLVLSYTTNTYRSFSLLFPQCKQNSSIYIGYILWINGRQESFAKTHSLRAPLSAFVNEWLQVKTVTGIICRSKAGRTKARLVCFVCVCLTCGTLSRTDTGIKDRKQTGLDSLATSVHKHTQSLLHLNRTFNLWMCMIKLHLFNC